MADADLTAVIMGGLFALVAGAIVVQLTLQARTPPRIAAALGLRARRTPSHWRLHGTVDGCPVQLYIWHRRTSTEPGQEGFHVKVGAPDLPPGVRISPRRLDQAAVAGSDPPGEPTGDPALDTRFAAGGDAPTLSALLDAETRQQVLRRWSTGIVDGEVLGRYNAPISADAAVTQVRELVAFARGLTVKPGVRQRLLANVRQDPVPTVRLRNLDHLCDGWPTSPETEQALEAALDDADPRVRFRAGRQLGDAGNARLAALVLEPHPPEIRTEVLRYLVDSAAQGVVLPLLKKLLRADEALRVVAIAALGRLAVPAALDALLTHAADLDASSLPPWTEAITAFSDPRVEPALLGLLDHWSEAVRVAAARALGEVGTVAAVAPLLDHAKTWLAGELKQAARDAVRRIQSRLGDAEAGGLSVVGSVGAGGLSVTEADES